MQDRMSLVFLSAANSLDYVENVFRLYDAGTVFAIVKDASPTGLHPGLFASDLVQVGARLGWGRLEHHPKLSDDPAQIVLTSGTEGRPKPVLLSHRNLADAVSRLNAAMGLDGSVREYIGVPVTFSFGLGRVRAISAVGGAFYLPERFDPLEIRDMLVAGEINAISAVPSLWRIILASPDTIGAAGQKVRWIEIGSQSMSGAEKAAMKALFPNARIVQHYGLTEASRTTFLDVSQNDGDMLESVGSGGAGTELRIGPDGEICIRGDHVALGIVDESGVLQPIVDADGWLHTRDRGEIRNGVLWYLGRLDDQINIAGVKLGAEALERDIRALVKEPGDFAVAAVPDPLRGETVLLSLAHSAGEGRDLLVAAAELALKRHGIVQSGALKVQVLDRLPTTDTGKVRRKSLSETYIAGAAATLPRTNVAPEAMPKLTPTEQRLTDAWKTVVGDISITADQNFYLVGGDSLSAVQIGLVMELGFSRPAVRATLEGRSVQEIALLEDCTQEASTDGISGSVKTEALPKTTIESWAINATRGFMVLTVLLSHWGPGLTQRLKIGDLVDPVLSIFYRMGTAGFASVFGIGLGFFMLPRLPAQRASVAKRLRSSLTLVLSGLVLTAIVSLTLDMLSGSRIDGRTIAESFYNVLAYYVIALAVALPCLGFLARRRDPLLWSVAIGLVLWPVGWLVVALLPADPLSSVLEWPRLLLVAKYSIFRTGPLTFLGIAVGFWLQRQPDGDRAARNLVAFGAVGFAFLALCSFEIYGAAVFSSRSSALFNTVLGWAVDFCFALCFAGVLMQAIRRWADLPAVPKSVVKALILVGGLALPIFAFHRIVIPVKDILVHLGISETVGLMVTLAAFLSAFAYGFLRLRRMYFP